MDWNSLLHRRPDAAVHALQPAVLPARRRPGPLPGRLRRGHRRPGPLRHRGHADLPRRRRVHRRRQRRTRRARPQRLIVATGVSQPYVPAIPGIEPAERYDDVSRRPGRLHRPAGADHRQGQLGVRDRRRPDGDRRGHPRGRAAARCGWPGRPTTSGTCARSTTTSSTPTSSSRRTRCSTARCERIDAATAAGTGSTFRFARADEVVRELRYDRVIACTGFRFDASIFDDGCRPELVINDRFPAQTAEWESVNVPGLYFAGTLTQAARLQEVHQRLHPRLPLRRARPAPDPRAPATTTTPWPADDARRRRRRRSRDAIIARVNRTSALWQQFGFLGDVVTVAGDGARYHEEVPVDYVARRRPRPGRRTAFVVTLEYGPDHDQVDPFDITVRRVARERRGGNAHDASLPAPGRALAPRRRGRRTRTTWPRTWRTSGTGRRCTCGRWRRSSTVAWKPR